MFLSLVVFTLAVHISLLFLSELGSDRFHGHD